MSADILLIERDLDLLDLTVDVLISYGLKVQACNDFSNAISYLENSTYSLVISSDLLDKDKTAEDVLNALRVLCSKTSFALLSAAPATFENTFLKRIDLIIEKPFDVEDMCLQVKPLLEK